MRHLITVEDLTTEVWDELFTSFTDIISHPDDYADACRGKVMASLFYEPSTRTAFSFQTAMMRLGGSVFGFSDPTATSASKGEAMSDTIRMCSAYADAIVMRHPRDGAAKAASLFSEVPLINAGDGAHMHPTQTLTDLATIRRLRGTTEGLNIGLCGDLKNGRTVHSLIMALSRWPGNRFYLISPRELALPDYMLAFMKQRNQWYIEVTGLDSTIPQLDVLYMTRIQRERFADERAYNRNRGIYILSRKMLARSKPDLIVMHPLPRVDEIARDVDSDPKAVYFEQARFGMFIRMALLLRQTALPRLAPEYPEPNHKKPLCKNPACITQTERYLPPLTHKNGGKLCCSYCDSALRP